MVEASPSSPSPSSFPPPLSLLPSGPRRLLLRQVTFVLFSRECSSVCVVYASVSELKGMCSYLSLSADFPSFTHPPLLHSSTSSLSRLIPLLTHSSRSSTSCAHFHVNITLAFALSRSSPSLTRPDLNPLPSLRPHLRPTSPPLSLFHYLSHTHIYPHITREYIVLVVVFPLGYERATWSEEGRRMACRCWRKERVLTAQLARRERDRDGSPPSPPARSSTRLGLRLC